MSEAFDINSGVKQGCVLAPTLFNIFFSVLLKHAFKFTEEGILLRTRSDGKLFNPARLRAKTKVRKAILRNFIFADDAALVAHNAEMLQSLLNQFSSAYEAFRLTIGLKKTKVNEASPTLTIKDHTLEVVPQFTYLGSTTSNNACLDVELGKRIGKTATNMAKLSARVWENKKLTTQTKIAVYRACIVSTLLYGCWVGEALEHLPYGMSSSHPFISWTDKVSNNEVLERTDVPSMFTLLRQRRLRWLGHVHRMEDGRIPKDLLYGELESGSRPVGRLKLRVKDVCKRDMLATGLPTGNWGTHAADRGEWRSVCSRALQVGETRLKAEADEKRAKRKAAAKKTASAPAASDYICGRCGGVCRSRIGILSHERKCWTQVR